MKRAHIYMPYTCIITFTSSFWNSFISVWRTFPMHSRWVLKGALYASISQQKAPEPICAALPRGRNLASIARNSSFSSPTNMRSPRVGKGVGLELQASPDCCSQPSLETSRCAQRSFENNSYTENMDCSQMGAVLPASPQHLNDAVAALRKGQVIAVPTDTLYGFAADASSGPAVQRIYAIKGRSNTNPLALCLAHLEDLEKYSNTSYLPEGLLEELFPGPVTTVLQRGEHSLLDKCLNPGLASIGIRIPDSAFIQQLVESFRGGLALTSANLSGQASTICIQEFEQLWGHCAFVFDAGILPAVRAGSTIVDLTVPGIYKILREGSALESTGAALRRYGLREAAP